MSTSPHVRPPHINHQAMKITPIRQFALSLDAVSEAPHHHFSSFRVRGKIFVTIPPGDAFLHIFVDEEDREPALALYPGFIEKLTWGAKVVGLRVSLATATPAVVKALVAKAYKTRVRRDAGPRPPKRRAVVQQGHPPADQPD